MVLKQEDFCCHFIIYIIFLLVVFQGEKYNKSTWQPLPSALPRLSLDKGSSWNSVRTGRIKDRRYWHATLNIKSFTNFGKRNFTKTE